jgi:hypothetical protein
MWMHHAFPLKTLSANYGACAKDVDNEQFWSENEANFQN